ncbi:hypothetical protein, partial [Limosilactobacillus reuteri]|uniref:hypothetical protein n=1 Tax=Limosilactobacillus reuteri TaxID=1598 RepID=UPI00207D6560
PEKGKSYFKNSEIFIAASITGSSIQSGKVFLNSSYIGEIDPVGGFYSFIPENEKASKNGKNIVEIKIIDTKGDVYKDSVLFSIN